MRRKSAVISFHDDSVKGGLFGFTADVTIKAPVPGKPSCYGIKIFNSSIHSIFAKVARLDELEKENQELKDLKEKFIRLMRSADHLCAACDIENFKKDYKGIKHLIMNDLPLPGRAVEIETLTNTTTPKKENSMNKIQISFLQQLNFEDKSLRGIADIGIFENEKESLNIIKEPGIEYRLNVNALSFGCLLVNIFRLSGRKLMVLTYGDFDLKLYYTTGEEDDGELVNLVLAKVRSHEEHSKYGSCMLPGHAIKYIEDRLVGNEE